MDGPAVVARELWARYDAGGPDRLRGVDLELAAGQTCAVLGPNGCGKSTLLRCLAGLLTARGEIHLMGESQAALDRRRWAQLVALVPQHHEVAFSFTVAEVVAMGRMPHQSGWRAAAADAASVREALAACRLEALADVPVTALSGGEQKRVHIARAFAQTTPILLLDEATAHLDLAHALAVHRLLARRVRETDATCVFTTHDLAAAAAHADHILLMRAGEVVAQGAPDEVMTPPRLADVFDVELEVVTHGGRRLFVASKKPSDPDP